MDGDGVSEGWLRTGVTEVEECWLGIGVTGVGLGDDCLFGWIGDGFWIGDCCFLVCFYNSSLL